MNLDVLAQPKESDKRPIYFKGFFYETDYYCMIQPLTDTLIVSFRENEINKDRILNLEKQVKEKETEVEAVDTELQATNEIVAAQDTINQVTELQLDLSRKEERKWKNRENWKKVKGFFKDTWEIFTAAAGGVVIGAGVGYAAK